MFAFVDYGKLASSDLIANFILLMHCLSFVKLQQLHPLIHQVLILEVDSFREVDAIAMGDLEAKAILRLVDSFDC